MSNLLALVKIEFRKFLSSLTSGKKKARQTPLIYVLIGLGLLMILLSVSYSFLIIFSYKEAGLDPSPSVGFFAGVVSLFIFMSSMSQARSIYIGEDYDMLTTLPIRKRDIVASKVITLYAIELAFSLAIMVPYGIMMIVLANNLTSFWIALLLAFTLPIVPIAIAALISLLVAMATARFKSANIIFVALYTLVIVGLTSASVIISNLSKEAAASSFGTMGGVLKWINPSYILVELAFNENMLFIILYAGINLVVAVVTILFLSLFFDKLHEIVSSISMKKTYVRTDLKVKSQGRILLGLEFKRLLNSKMYLINTIMGSIMTVVGSTIFIVSFSAPMTTASAEAIETLKAVAAPLVIVIIMLIIGIGNPATGCINIEGKTFWLIKSLPTNYRKYMRIKLYYTWILTLPAVLIAATISIIFFHNTVWDIVGVIFLPLAYAILNSLVGLTVAIRHPKLKWSNEAEAVKNAASVLIGMLLDFAFVIVLGTPLIIFPILIPQYAWIGLVAIFSIVVILILVFYLYLRKNFAKKIDQMEDL